MDDSLVLAGYKEKFQKHDTGHQLMNCDGVLRMMLRISPVSGHPYLGGTVDCSLDNIY